MLKSKFKQNFTNDDLWIKLTTSGQQRVVDMHVCDIFAFFAWVTCYQFLIKCLNLIMCSIFNRCQWTLNNFFATPFKSILLQQTLSPTFNFLGTWPTIVSINLFISHIRWAIVGSLLAYSHTPLLIHTICHRESNLHFLLSNISVLSKLYICTYIHTYTYICTHIVFILKNSYFVLLWFCILHCYFRVICHYFNFLLTFISIALYTFYVRLVFIL